MPHTCTYMLVECHEQAVGFPYKGFSFVWQWRWLQGRSEGAVRMLEHLCHQPGGLTMLGVRCQNRASSRASTCPLRRASW